MVLKILRIAHERIFLLTEFQLNTRGKPPLGTAQAVVERGPVNVLCVFREDDCRALEPQGLLTGLKDELRFVVPPCAVGGSNDRLTVGRDGGRWAIENIIPIMSLGAIFYLRVAPINKIKRQ